IWRQASTLRFVGNRLMSAGADGPETVLAAHALPKQVSAQLARDVYQRTLIRLIDRGSLLGKSQPSWRVRSPQRAPFSLAQLKSCSDRTPGLNLQSNCRLLGAVRHRKSEQRLPLPALLHLHGCFLPGDKRPCLAQV